MLQNGGWMMSFVGKLLPIHGYRVVLANYLPHNYQLSLSHLYQPLIGMQAVMLYQTLLNENNLLGERSIRTHHSLMNYLKSPLDIIYNERLKLEAIGLLKTYESIEEQQKIFTYYLQSPFAPNEFFHDPMLAELLYHHLGDKMYSQLKNQFIAPIDMSLQQKEVSATFSDVFTTIKPALQEKQHLTNHRESRINLQQQTEDFPIITTSLKQRFIQPETVLTRTNKRLISDMMHLYHLTEHDVEKCVLWALADDHSLDHEEFKAACHDIFKTEKNAFIQLQEKQRTAPQNQPVIQQEESRSTKDQLSELLETISLRQLLEGLTKGQASEKELIMIREIMQTHQLKPAVMNVLVHYVLTRTNKKLSGDYLETIASHWARVQLNTAKEAMDFVQKEIDKAKNSKQRRQNNRVKHQEVIPDWFKKQREQRKKTAKKAAVNNQAESYDEDEILALFHKHSSENKNKQG